jgi:anti-sigma factor RsiW
MNDGQPHDVEELGAYAAGALDEDASRAVEEHVAACPSCRAELAELQAVSALLSAVPVEVFEHTPVLPAEIVPRADPAEPHSHR